jgi:hypothetical protein
MQTMKMAAFFMMLGSSSKGHLSKVPVLPLTLVKAIIAGGGPLRRKMT